MTQKKKPIQRRLVKPKQDSDVAELARLMSEHEVSDIYHNSYLSRTTIKRLMDRKTRVPQHMTMQGIAAAIGLVYVLRRKGDEK